jgi:hypothetical protein
VGLLAEAVDEADDQLKLFQGVVAVVLPAATVSDL